MFNAITCVWIRSSLKKKRTDYNRRSKKRWRECYQQLNQLIYIVWSDISARILGFLRTFLNAQINIIGGPLPLTCFVASGLWNSFCCLLLKCLIQILLCMPNSNPVSRFFQVDLFLIFQSALKNMEGLVLESCYIFWECWGSIDKCQKRPALQPALERVVSTFKWVHL